MNTYFLYILTNTNKTVLYIWITNDLERRLYEHKNKLVHGFTSEYNISKLVYIETSSNIDDMIAREKQLKRWSRIKKTHLIESMNPYWKDLSSDWES